MDRGIMTCDVFWCPNKCDLYKRQITGLTRIVITSLFSDGYCPYRPVYTCVGYGMPEVKVRERSKREER